HQIVNVAVDPRAFGNCLALNLHISNCHSLHVYLQDVRSPLHFEHAGASVRHLKLVGHLGQSIVTDHFENLLA
ncbi:hypothetical protein PENTCL1PPCAC_15122, partial [Pristionchus entomophagus]